MKVIFETVNPALINEVNSFIEEWNSPSPTIIVSTSGSTGIPKAISLSKLHMEASAKMTGEYLKIRTGNRALLCLSPKTIAGKMMIVRSIVLGLELIVVDLNSNPLDHFNSEIDFAAMVPLQVQNCVANSSLSHIQKLIVGGGVISEKLWNSIASFPTESFQTFGMTETISHVAMREIKINHLAYSALPGVSFGISNGCLTVSAPHIGVSNLRTNDTIDLIDSKHFIWLGRKDFVINSGGVKIHPEQVEATLSSLIDSPFFSGGIDDVKYGSKHILCVESKQKLDLNKEHFKKYLDKHILPKEIYYFDSFSYTESHKINRAETLKKITNAEKQVL